MNRKVGSIGLFALGSIVAAIAVAGSTGCSATSPSKLDHYKQPAIDAMYSAIEKFVAENHHGMKTKFNGKEYDGKNLALNHLGGYGLSLVFFVEDGNGDNEPCYQARISTDDSNKVIRFAVVGPPDHSSQIIIGKKDWFEMEAETTPLPKN